MSYTCTHAVTHAHATYCCTHTQRTHTHTSLAHWHPRTHTYVNTISSTHNLLPHTYSNTHTFTHTPCTYTYTLRHTSTPLYTHMNKHNCLYDPCRTHIQHLLTGFPGCHTPSVIVSGSSGAQISRMGLFQLQPELIAGGKAVYKSSNDQFLYYWPKYADWLISADYKQDKAGVGSYSGTGTACPQDSTNWKERKNGKFVSSSIIVEPGITSSCARDLFQANTPGCIHTTHRYCRIHPCIFTISGCRTPNVIVSGSSEAQINRMGLFRLQPELIAGGKAVYKNSNDQFLYYWPKYADWLISADYKQDKAGVGSYSGTGTACPQDSTDWKEIKNGKFVASSIIVKPGICNYVCMHVYLKSVFEYVRKATCARVYVFRVMACERASMCIWLCGCWSQICSGLLMRQNQYPHKMHPYTYIPILCNNLKKHATIHTH